MESSTPMPNTIVPIIAVNTLTFTEPPLINNGCQRTTTATAVMVNIANLGDRNRIAIVMRRMPIVAIVVSDCES